MRTKRPFTLIELLISIAVIAILFAMLLPGLMRVKIRARRVVCMNNMKQVATANALYASDSKQRIAPPMNAPLNLSIATLNGPYAYPWRLQLVRWNTSGIDKAWWNISNLYATGYVSDPGVFYCSGRVSTGYHGSNGTFGSYRSGDWAVMMDYYYNPYKSTGSTLLEKRSPLYAKLSKAPPEKVQLTEYPTIGLAGKKHGVGFNVCRFDGSVRWDASDSAIFAAVNYTTSDWTKTSLFVKALEKK